MRAVAALVALGPIAALALVLGWGWGEPPLPDPVLPAVRPAAMAALPPAPAGDAVTGPKPPVAVVPVPQPESPATPRADPPGRPEVEESCSDDSMLTLLVLDESSQPIPDARVESSKANAVTDARGMAHLRFRWTSVCGGLHHRMWSIQEIRFSAAGYATTKVLVEGWTVPHMVWLHRGQRISGTCVDGAGNPVVGLKLTLRPDLGTTDLDVTTDAQGHFACAEAGQCAYTVVVEDPLWIASVPPVVPPEEGLRVVLFRPARLTGRLQSPPQSRDVCRGCCFRLGPDVGTVPEGRWVPTEPNHDSSSFAFDCLPGWVTLVSRGRVLARFFLLEGEVYESGVHLIPPDARPDLVAEGDQEAGGQEQENSDAADTSITTARVCGSLLDTGGQPVAHGTLELCPVGARRAAVGVQEEHDEFPRSMRPPSGPWSPAPSAFARGIFDLGGVRSGTYDLVWTPRTWQGQWQRGVRAVLRRAIRIPEPAADIDLGTLVLDLRAAAFSVRVLAASGGYVPGAIVWLMDEHRVEAAARTDAAGFATFRVFDPSGLEIAVGPPEARTVCGALPVTVGQTSEPITVVMPE